MKASDFIVEYLISRGINDVFGYPGGMVTHLMDSFAKYAEEISAHVTYHEQGASFAACGYAQASGKVGVAYATSGPGATNLVTGICNAYFDSIPTVFITGQVNTNEAKGDYGVRQRGFQETDIVSIVKPVTKYATYVESADKLKKCLDDAFYAATNARMGPALLDIPMNVFRAEVSETLSMATIDGNDKTDVVAIVESLTKLLEESSRPCILIGNGVKMTHGAEHVKKFIDKYSLPVITSMIAFDALGDDSNCYGFLGAYGTRTANFIAAKSDLIVSIGSRLDIRQVGAIRSNFAPEAKIVRFDIDAGELSYPLHEKEYHFCVSMKTVTRALDAIVLSKDYSPWRAVCKEIQRSLMGIDQNNVVALMEKISTDVPAATVITTDVGQNQVWVAQSFKLKRGQQVLFSGGHGAMGYSLPAAIGACYAVGKKTVLCIAGDGGMQMNIQELQFIAREKLPVKVVVLNNNALGMIRHFQEMYFDGRYFQTKPEGGYSAPNFAKIAEAYGIKSRRIAVQSFDGIAELFEDDKPALVEILIDGDTYVTPKLEFGKPNQDQEPLLDRVLYNRIMGM